MSNPTKTVVLPPKGHTQTAEEIAPPESIDVRVVEEGEVMVVGVSIDAEECLLEQAMRVPV